MQLSCSLDIDQKHGKTKMFSLSLQAHFSTKFKISESPTSHRQIFSRSLHASLCKKCPYLVFFWSVFSRIWLNKERYGDRDTGKLFCSIFFFGFNKCKSFLIWYVSVGKLFCLTFFFGFLINVSHF